MPQGVVQGQKTAIKLMKTSLGEYSDIIHGVLSLNP